MSFNDNESSSGGDITSDDNEGSVRHGITPSVSAVPRLAPSAKVIPLGRLLRLPEVLSIMAIGRSTWYDGIREGVYPSPVRVSARRVAWPEEKIRDLVRQLASPN